MNYCNSSKFEPISISCIFPVRIETKKTMDIDFVLNIVSTALKVPKECMLSKRRLIEYVNARKIAICMLRIHYPLMTLKAIGKVFGMDHSTVIYAINSSNDLLFSDKYFRDDYNRIKKRLKPFEAKS